MEPKLLDLGFGAVMSSKSKLNKGKKAVQSNLCESSGHTCHNTPWVNQTRHCGKLLSKPGRSFLRGTTCERNNGKGNINMYVK